MQLQVIFLMEVLLAVSPATLLNSVLQREHGESICSRDGLIWLAARLHELQDCSPPDVSPGTCSAV